MRYRLMATYQGSPFEAGMGPTDGDIVLFAACPPPEELGFEPATGHWRKQLPINDVQAVWESRPVGSFRGERCLVLDDLGDRLHIGYLGHDGYQAEQLGYWQVDRGVFELIAPRTEVTDILEERTDYQVQHVPAGLPPAMPPAAGPGLSYWQGDGPSGAHRAPSAAVVTEPRGSGSHPSPDYFPAADQASDFPAADQASDIALPSTGQAPLPLEAEALRAASAARRPRSPAVAPVQSIAPGRPFSRQRRAARRRMATERLFADLASQAGIPADRYAIGAEIDGALCLVQSEQGFEVFHAAGGARHERQTFASEEAACFYLFGVLAAEAVRTGLLTRAPAGKATSQTWTGLI